MLQHSRITSAVVLLAVLIAGGAAFWYVRRAEAKAATAPELAQLELLITKPDAEPVTWFHYGQRLLEAGRLTHAATAFERFLQLDPFHRDGNLQCAVVLAQLGDPDKYFRFMRHLVSSDPKLAAAILDRPESQPHLAEPRFRALAKEAQMQAMD
jgi:predicted Zn-dependent protease